MQFLSHFIIMGCLKGFYPFLLVTPSPLSPSPWQGEGELIERGASPLLDTPIRRRDNTRLKDKFNKGKFEGTNLIRVI
jgi:hypothetical protein